MYKHSICTCLMVGNSPLQCFLQPPSGNKGLNTGNNTEIIVFLSIFPGFNFTAKFIYAGKLLTLT